MIPTQESTDPITKIPQAPKKSSKLGVILLIVLLLVAVGVGVYFLTKPKPKTTAPQAVTQSSTASLSLSPATGSVQKGKTLTVSVFEDSGDKPVNAVQAVVTYPADKFDFQSIDAAGSAFEIQAESTGAGGKITIARGQQGPVVGKHLVAKINLVAKADSGQAALDFADSSALVTSTDNKNILSQKTGGNYTFEAAQ